MFLRSCNRGNANNEWNVNNSGNVNNNNANNTNRGCPDCIARAIRLAHSVGTRNESKRYREPNALPTSAKQHYMDAAIFH